MDTLGQLAGHGLGLGGVQLLRGLLDQGDDVPLTQDAAGDAAGVEHFQRVDLLARADVFDRQAGDGAVPLHGGERAHHVHAGAAIQGHDVGALIFVISADNLSSGIASAAFIAYLSSLTNINYTATQYALLTALAAVGRTYLSAGAGYVAQATGWPTLRW